jgi:hypothetical protein
MGSVAIINILNFIRDFSLSFCFIYFIVMIIKNLILKILEHYYFDQVFSAVESNNIYKSFYLYFISFHSLYQIANFIFYLFMITRGEIIIRV